MEGGALCETLQEKNLIDDEIRSKFRKVMFYAIKKHSNIVRLNYNYMNELLLKYRNVATNDDWEIFKPWILEMIHLINKKDLQQALELYIKKVIYLTEKFNRDYSLLTLLELDCYLSLHKKYFSENIMVKGY